MKDNHIRSRFPLYFRESLLKKYHKIPSASWIAQQFNKQNDSSYHITGETVRKWLNGKSLPSPKNIATIIEWLDIDYNSIFQSPQSSNGFVNKNSFLEIDDQYLNKIITDNLNQLDKTDRIRAAFIIMSLRSIQDPMIFDLFKKAISDE